MRLIRIVIGPMLCIGVALLLTSGASSPVGSLSATTAGRRIQSHDTRNGDPLPPIRKAQLSGSRERVRATLPVRRPPSLASRVEGGEERHARAAATPSPRMGEKDHALVQRAIESALGWEQPDLRGSSASATQPSSRLADHGGRTVPSGGMPAVRPVLSPPVLSPPVVAARVASGQGDAVDGYRPEPHGAGPWPPGTPPPPSAHPVQVSAYQRAYDQYLARVRQRVDPLWEFPRELAVRMEQGEVLVGFTIQKDGSVKDVHVLKGSGFPKFDKNVVGAIKRAGPFEPLPPLFGPELRVTSPFVGSNPAIR